MKRSHIESALKRNSTCNKAVDEQIRELETQKGKLFRIRCKLILKAYSAGYAIRGDSVITEKVMAD